MAAVTQMPVFARRLLQARLRAGLTQQQLGEAAGLEASVASPRVNQYEKGRHAPKLETAKSLADALGIPPAFLYCEDELLAKLLLRWSELNATERKELVRLAGAPSKHRPDR